MAFGERLRKLRKGKGMTQAALATAVGLSNVQVNRYENGASSPTMPTLRSLVVALGTTADELVFDADERQASDEVEQAFTAARGLDEADQKLVTEMIACIVARHDVQKIASGFGIPR